MRLFSLDWFFTAERASICVFVCVTDLRDVRHNTKRLYFNLCFQHNHTLLNMPLAGGGL